MKYLVLYTIKLDLAHDHRVYGSRGLNDTGNALYATTAATFSMFTNRQEAIEFARRKNGEIVEAFSWHITKDKSAT